MVVINPFKSIGGLGKPVCVFCASSPGSSPLYAKAAESIGRALAGSKVPLVYGGGRRGLMGVVSQATLDAGGHVHGILPRALIERASERASGPDAAVEAIDGDAEIEKGAVQSGEGVGADLLADDFGGRLTMEVVGSMHERKAKMAELSIGGFVVLPGGYGTFEEVLEMITWNQLGIHSLPIIIMNIGNFYSPLLAQFEKAVEAGFIARKNLSLMRIVDLPGGEAANADEAKAGEWGAVAIKSLEEWTVPEDAGYGFDWKKKDELAGKVESASSSSKPESSTAPASPSASAATASDPPALFSTLRYTSPPSPASVSKASVHLVDLHILRLQEAHAHFSGRDARWGAWVGNEAVWTAIRAALEAQDKEKRGDWRVRVVVHPGPRLEIHVVPAPTDAGPFRWVLDPPPPPSPKRRLLLDPVDTVLGEGEDDWRLYKTVRRDMYDAASDRGARALGEPGTHPEVLQHTPTRLLETNTSNVALELPGLDGAMVWLTPALRPGAPFLNGVFRRHLLAAGQVVEAELTVDDFARAKREGRRVVGFNGLRGIWEAELV
ncbi:hypothetical protein Q5752_001664 [Cryptotrichosporon argae]